MVKIIVCGARGRMGKNVVDLVFQEKEAKLTGAVEAPNHPSIGKEIRGIKLTSDLERVIQKDAVIIEFTIPEASMNHLNIAKKRGIPIVIGTTGFTEEEKAKIKESSLSIPILFSPNMSIGINLLFNIVGEIAHLLGEGFDKEIIELHHRHKKDAPSGTAKKIAQIIAEAEGKKLSEVGIYGRRGETGERSTEEIGIHSVRGGTVPGEHKIIFAGAKEELEITHRAESRYIFARGALLGAKFIAKQKNGLYTLQDVLKIRNKK
ncbi:MAG: 4-hydroxy-tetrahydrodipicolinate reductase [Candidatus Aerophobetes bacterium]|nr:4-hydroxy-tetrahydrodipicolinate reductase [Candidatus Aerophobetes bacterium]